MSEHAIISPSGMSRILLCPGSVAASAPIEDAASIHASEGTAAHKLGEDSILLGVSPHDLVGTVITADGVDFAVTKEMADAVAMYVTMAEARHEEMGKDETVMLVEQRVSLEPHIPETWGTADLVLINRKDLLVDVWDYKHGKGIEVEAKNNTQMMTYALGVLSKLREEGWTKEELDAVKVNLRIVQPRTASPVDDNEWDVSPAALREIYKLIKVQACRALDMMEGKIEPVFTPGETQCRWCKAAPSCPKLAEAALAEASEFWSESFRDEVENQILKGNEKAAIHKAEETAAVLMPGISDDKLVDMLASAKLAKTFAKAVEAEALSRAMQGNILPKHKLVRGRSTRKWDDADALIQMAVDSGLSTDELDLMAPRTLLSPAKMEKLSGGKKRFSGGPYASHVVKTEGRLNLVHESDKRDAVTATAEADFSEFAE